METIMFAWLLVILTITSPVAKSAYYSSSQIIDVPATIKETHLHFFMHDILSGDNPSAVLVAKPKNTVVQEGNPVPFGAVYVFDDPLMEGPGPNTKVIGNAHGLYASASHGIDTMFLTCDCEFTSGEFKGSSISVASRDPLMLAKEMAVVGGRGKFRMAQGFILSKVVFLNATKGDAILEWNVTIFHQ